MCFVQAYLAQHAVGERKGTGMVMVCSEQPIVGTLDRQVKPETSGL